MALIGIDSWQPFPDAAGYSVDNTELRVWYSRSFQDSDRVTVQGGDGQTGFYITSPVTVTSNLSIASFNIRTTLDAIDPAPQSIQVYARLFSNNAPKAWIFAQNGGPNGWVIPNPDPATTMTYDDLAIYNQATTLANPPLSFLTAPQTLALIEGITPAPDASDITIGISKLSVAPVSSINPIAVGDNDPRNLPDPATNNTQVPYSTGSGYTSDSTFKFGTYNTIAKSLETQGVVLRGDGQIYAQTGMSTYPDGSPTPAGTLSGSLQGLDGVSMSVLSGRPTQTTTARTGNPMFLWASNAREGSSVVGAADGGKMEIRSGDAARLTSGDANGGVLAIIPGGGIGTGRPGYLGFGTNTPATNIHFVVGGSATETMMRLSAATPTIGGEITYDESANTTFYLYNRYAGNAASAIKLGFEAAGFGNPNVITILQSGLVTIDGILGVSEGSDLTISSNAVTVTKNVHHIGAGLLKTINESPGLSTSIIALIPDGAFTTDTSGNIGKASTAVIGQAMIMVRSSSTAKWYPSY